DLQVARLGPVGRLGPLNAIGVAAAIGPVVSAAPVAIAAGAAVHVALGPQGHAFVLADQGDRLLSQVGGAAATGARTAARGLLEAVSDFVRVDWSSTPTRPPLTVSRDSLLAQLTPAVTLTR